MKNKLFKNIISLIILFLTMTGLVTTIVSTVKASTDILENTRKISRAITIPNSYDFTGLSGESVKMPTLPKATKGKNDKMIFLSLEERIKVFIFKTVLPLMKKAVIPIFIITAIFIGYKMSTGLNEETIKKQKNKLLVLLLAIGIVTMAAPIVEIVYYGGNVIGNVEKDDYADPGEYPLWDKNNEEKVLKRITLETSGIVNTAVYILSGIAIFIIIINSFLMFFANGDEAKFSEGKKGVIYACIGLILIGLSSILVKTLYGDMDLFSQGRADDLGANFEIGMNEIVGILNFALSFIGAIAVVMMIYAGYLYLTAGGEEDRTASAIKIITSTITGIIIILLAYVIINTFFQ